MKPKPFSVTEQKLVISMIDNNLKFEFPSPSLAETMRSYNDRYDICLYYCGKAIVAFFFRITNRTQLRKFLAGFPVMDAYSFISAVQQ